MKQRHDPTALAVAINSASKVLNDAELKDVDAHLYGVAQALDAYKISLSALESTGKKDAIEAIANTRGFNAKLRETAFVIEKIHEDPELSMQLHKRIVRNLKVVDAFGPNTQGRLTSNFVAEIEVAHKDLQKLDLSDPSVGNEPGMTKARPKEQVFTEAIDSLRGLKGKLAMAELRR